MTSERDLDAITSWERAERAPDPGGTPQPYVCTECDWTGRGETALGHFRATGHAIRGKRWPASWGHCEWSPRVRVSLCAWCEGSRERTARLVAHGIEVSHTICPTHADAFMRGL